ncbi:MAG TPA: redoxin [Micrococcales bacterium]|jgi:peroxiredoxin|uniref:peroxiredoxin family protein n=1 Tax=Miniimonas arenae TaxID=676201 RepID=UPI000ECE0045|nr:peroxiredoxin family protein [Miniimonas arenae]HCX84694.1 redoxin [Micrococcales bacterium]
MTSGSATKRARERQELLSTVRAKQNSAERRHRLLIGGLWGLLVLVVVGLIAAALWTARPQTSAEVRVAPDFTLPDSDGGSVTLSDLRGSPVLLYFSEGAGCDACIVQQAKIEAEPGFAEAGITVLPIVMNTAEQINADRDRLGGKTAYLLDDGTVSKEYDTLGKGMHPGLPGHGFVLIDADGNQVWQADYPSMWIEPSELLATVRDKL